MSQLNTFLCALCENTFPTNKDLVNHKSVHDSENRIFTCDKIRCVQSFTDHREYLLHQVTHLNQKETYRCIECGVVKPKNSVIIHILTHFKERKQACNVCGLIFSNEKMKAHAKTHSSFKKYFKCTVCEKTLSETKRVLHMENHARERKTYKCEYCGKVYCTKYDYHYHVNMHSGVKTEICDVCGFRSYHPKTISHHKKKHLVGDRLDCDYCKITMFDRSAFITHIKRHLAGYKCRFKKCKYFAPSQAKLKKHRIEMHYYCKICRQGYLNASQRKRHERSIKHKDNKMLLKD